MEPALVFALTDYYLLESKCTFRPKLYYLFFLLCLCACVWGWWVRDIKKNSWLARKGMSINIKFHGKVILKN